MTFAGNSSIYMHIYIDQYPEQKRDVLKWNLNAVRIRFAVHGSPSDCVVRVASGSGGACRLPWRVEDSAHGHAELANNLVMVSQLGSLVFPWKLDDGETSKTFRNLAFQRSDCCQSGPFLVWLLASIYTK